MKTLGVTGNIGSGKSFICSILMKMGIPYYNCDSRSKHIINTDESVQKEIVALIGPKAYNEGLFDRNYVSKCVLSDNSLLNRLENIMKKPMLDDLNSFKSQYINKGLICLESAILLQTDFRSEVDDVLLITSNMDIKIKRITERDVFRSKEEIDLLFNNQLCEEDMLKVCKYNIININKTEIDLKKELEIILNNFKNDI